MFSAFFLHQYLATLSALLHLISVGNHEAWTSVYLPVLLNETNTVTISNEEGSSITEFLFIGTFAGCIIAFIITDKIGRKNTILITCIPFLLAALILAYAESVALFCTVRVIAGIAAGISLTVIPLYISEIAHPKIRGALGMLTSVFNIFGFLFMNVVGSYLNIFSTSIISAMMPVLLVLTFTWASESPYYLIMKGNFEGAKSALALFRGRCDVDDELESIKEAVATQCESKGNFSELFVKKSNRKAFIMTFIVMNGKQFTSEASMDAYAQSLFGKLVDFMSPTLISVVYYLTKLAMVFVDSICIDKIGRKPLIILSFMCTGLSLFSLGTLSLIKLHNPTEVGVSDYFALACLILFAIFTGLLEPMPNLMISELFPMNVKVCASFLFQIYFFFLDMIVVKIFQTTSDRYGIDVPFFMFSGSCFVHLFLICIFFLETKGKTLEQIQQDLQDN